MSPDVIASSVNSLAAQSPAAACSDTPSNAACSGLYPCASNPNITPVNTSPDPAVAMPLFPVVLNTLLPSGKAVMVNAPFNTTTA